MAKRKKVLPARKQERDRSRDDDESLLMRSAETLGRMIGTLQRQLDGAAKRLSKAAGDGPSSKRKTGTSNGTRKTASARGTSARKTAGSRKTGAARTRSATRSAKKR